MKRRALLVLVCIVALLVVAVPVAQAEEWMYVGGVDPNGGYTGTTSTYVVGAGYFTPIGPLNFTPHIWLANGFTTIDGYGVTVVGPTSATVMFTIPNDASPGLYDLHVQQTSGLLSYSGMRANMFTVQQRPTITSLEPLSATAGSGDLALTINGANFIKIYSPLPRQSLLQVNGTIVNSTYVSANKLTATIPAALLATPGVLQLVVVNTGTKYDPEIQSEPFPLVVKAPAAPVLASISPTTVWAGYVKNDVVLTATGTSFVSGARIALNGVDKSNTAFVSATQLTLPLAAADIATPGTVNVSVKNPPFPPGTPSAATVPLAVQAETSTPVVTIGGADSNWHNAPVPLTFTATDSQSGLQKIQYMAPPDVAAWTVGNSYTVPTSSQGAVTVTVQALDWCNNAGTASATVNIDTTKPGTQTRGNASVKKGNTAKLKYRITEPAGLSPTADVVIKVNNGKGDTVKTVTVGGATVNASLAASFTCNLKKGTYKWYVYATDLAGNTQANIANAKLTVK